MNFAFRGEVPASKSILNRWLTISTFADSHFQIYGNSKADDVIFLREGLKSLKSGEPIECGSGGTTFRFLALTASRFQGVHRLHVNPQLRARPHSGLGRVLEQLGVECEWQDQVFIIRSSEWKQPLSPIEVESDQTSQFLSSLILNAWNLPFAVEIAKRKQMVSPSYLQLTLDLVRQAGMKIDETSGCWRIPPHQRVGISHTHVESDMSSCFALAAIAAVSGHAEFLNFPKVSFQPDFVFISILLEMGVPVEHLDDKLVIFKSRSLKSISRDVMETPDLFPVLCVLCSAAEGRSKLRGARHLQYKESDRIGKTSELLSMLKIPHQVFPDGIELQGQSQSLAAKLAAAVQFDPADDHRLAMAAQLARYLGYQVQILNPHVVNKSFPEFWDFTGGWA